MLPAGVAAAQAELFIAFEEFVPRHSHSVGLILLFLQYTLQSLLGFRGAASALELCSPLFPSDETSPSPNGGQLWLLRLGLYELTRSKEVADDWVWIVDHTIQCGKGKCFVVTSVRAAVVEAKRQDPHSSGALVHQDLSVWQLEVVEKSDGPTVERQLIELSQQTGQIPRAVLSDCGGDLSAGIAAFCATHPGTIPLKDLPHFAANAIKKILHADPQWTEFLAETNRSKAQLRQTKFAFLLPPDLRSKARWMNLDPLIEWSENVQTFLDSPRPVPGVSWVPDELEAAMGWLRTHRPAVQRWTQMLNVVGASLKYIRKQGYHRQAQEELRQVLDELPRPRGSDAEQVANSLLDYVEQQSRPIPEGQHLPATSEALESLLGKAKQLQGPQSRSGFTKMILGIAASVSTLTAQLVYTALSHIKIEQVHEWTNKQIAASVQGQRYHALHALTAEQKADKQDCS